MSTTGYYAIGKQILLDGSHVADGRDEETSAMIVEALNMVYYPVWTPVDLETDYRMSDIESFDGPTRIAGHTVRQENDEYACSCGARWEVKEGDDHP